MLLQALSVCVSFNYFQFVKSGCLRASSADILSCAKSFKSFFSKSKVSLLTRGGAAGSFGVLPGLFDRKKLSNEKIYRK